MQQHTISVIIPAYNEKKKLRNVLMAVTQSNYIHEVICVDDGSTDGTAKIAKSVKRVQVIRLKKNHGKAYAIAKGIQKAKGYIVLFIDADIWGLNNIHIKKLIHPLQSKKYQVAVGYRSSAVEATVGRQLSGERAYFKKDLLPLVKKFQHKGYGLEIFLNYHFRDKKIKVFKLNGVYSTPKHYKMSYDKATKMYAKTTYEILNEFVKQENPASYVLHAFLYNFHLRDKDILEKPREVLKTINLPKIQL